MASDTLDQDVNTLNSLEQTFCSKTNAYNESIDEWNSLRDKNDNLELETAPVDIAEKVCRICFNLIASDSYLTIDAVETLINMCLPKIDLLLTKDPVVCQKCYAKLQEFYGFSVECMKAENELASYCTANQISCPINIYDFLKHTLKPDLVDVKQEDYPLGTVLDVDNEDDDLETLSHDIDVKTEDTNSDFVPSESSNAVKRPRKMLRKAKKTSTKKLKIRVAKKHFSSDLLEVQVKCETCEQRFTSKWALDRHTPVHNSENPNYYCESCNLKFKYKHSFNKHMSAHLSGVPPTKPFACECGKFFNRKSKLKKHQEIHIKKEKPFACKSCGKRFIDEKLLDSHVERVHISEKAFSCELCGNKYTSKAGLDVHFKSHFPSDNPRPEPDLMCDVCGKLFYRKYSLEKHRMSHTGDKPHECDQCSMKFKERYQLTIHMRRHTGEKPFKCEVCSFKFPSKNRLGVHMRTHTGVRPFPCQLCDMAFTRNDHLIKHVRAIHTGERPFECDICSKTFNRKDYLLKHKRVHFKRSL